ncbi:hypothetical protein [Streptomyces sp. NPDC002346]
MGEDGRSRTFRFAELPLPGLHLDLAHALGARVGPGGGRRTQRAATMDWQSIKRFVTLLAKLPVPPGRVEDFRVRHLERYLMFRRETCEEKSARRSLQDLLLLLRAVPDQDRLDSQVADYLVRRGHGVDVQQSSRQGYSDRELAAIMAAARSDVVAIRDRLTAGETLLARCLSDPGSLSEDEHEQGLRQHAAIVPLPTGRGTPARA